MNLFLQCFIDALSTLIFTMGKCRLINYFQAVSHNKKVCKGDSFLFPSLPSPSLPPPPSFRPFHRVTQLTGKHLFSLVEITTVRVKCCLITQGSTPKLSIGSKARTCLVWFVTRIERYFECWCLFVRYKDISAAVISAWRKDEMRSKLKIVKKLVDDADKAKKTVLQQQVSHFKPFRNCLGCLRLEMRLVRRMRKSIWGIVLV